MRDALPWECVGGGGEKLGGSGGDGGSGGLLLLAARTGAVQMSLSRSLLPMPMLLMSAGILGAWNSRDAGWCWKPVAEVAGIPDTAAEGASWVMPGVYAVERKEGAGRLEWDLRRAALV